MTRLRGVFPVLPTPFDASGAVGWEDLGRCVEFAVLAGVAGVVFPGFASEVQTLSAEERAEGVRRVGELVRGRAAFVVGAADLDPDAVALHARAGAEAGAIIAMVPAPHAIGRDVSRQVEWFGRVAPGLPLPLMLQNVGPPYGAGLTALEVAEVARAVPQIVAVKEETAPFAQNLAAIRAAAPHLQAIYGGAGGRYLTEELRAGASGTMPALELADLHEAMWRAWSHGRHAEARMLFRESLPLLNIQGVFRSEVTKRVLKARGVVTATGVRAKGPVPGPLDEAELADWLADLWPHLPVRMPLHA